VSIAANSTPATTRSGLGGALSAAQVEVDGLLAQGAASNLQRVEVLPMGLILTSPAFANNGKIPAQYTCDGVDVSPPLSWSGAPQGSRSFALIVDDPDAPDPKAPKVTWVHWVVYNIPADVLSLPEDAARRGLPAGAQQGLNDSKRVAYNGPCPPIGRHRYFHKLYALDAVLQDLGHPTKTQVLSAMQGHVLAEAQLVGTYEKGT
jgi:Raf kinase inhibitor-like YbhB/YbcL family protein